jgi:hypothetical protein
VSVVLGSRVFVARQRSRPPCVFIASSRKIYQRRHPVLEAPPVVQASGDLAKALTPSSISWDVRAGQMRRVWPKMKTARPDLQKRVHHPPLSRLEPTRRGPNASCTIRPVLSVIASTGNVPGSALRGIEPVWSRSNNGDTERAFDDPRTAHARPKGVLSTVATCCPAFRMTALTRSSLPRLFSDREHLRRQVFLCADDLASIDLD